MLEQKPDTVRVQAKDGLTEAAPETVQPGQTIVVEPGEKIHLDGTVLEGNAEVDTAALTGESIPVSVAPGMEVLAGSVAIDGALTIRVDKPYGDSAVARVLAALEHAQDSKSHTEKFITRFARIYTPIVCGIALALVLIPPLFFGGDWHEWIYRGLSALVVSCPCAIVISVPLSFFGGLGTCSREGILVKGADHLETLARCDVGVFDKTGTITSGKFEFVSGDLKKVLETHAAKYNSTPDQILELCNYQARGIKGWMPHYEAPLRHGDQQQFPFLFIDHKSRLNREGRSANLPWMQEFKKCDAGDRSWGCLLYTSDAADD